MVSIAAVPASTAAAAGSGVSLADLVGDVEEFFASRWNRRTHLHRRSADFGQLLDVADIDSILADRTLREPYLRLAAEGRPLHEKRYLRPLSVQGTALRGVADVEKISAEFDLGATVLLDSIDHYHRPVKQLCDRLHAELAAPAEAVAFVTPRSVQGLTAHYDNTEVFVLQLFGRKRWTVYPQIRPLVPVGKVLGSQELGEPELTVELEPGDCLYIPWGSPHYAVSIDQISGHLSIMVRPPTWGSVSEQLIDRLVPSPTHEPVPLGCDLDPTAVGGELQDRARTAASRIASADLRPDLMELRRAALPRPMARARFLEQSASIAALSSESRIARNPEVAFSYQVADNGSILLKVDGRTFRYPAAARPVVRDLESMTVSTVGELAPEVSTTSKLKLIGHIIENGIVHVIP